MLKSDDFQVALIVCAAELVLESYDVFLVRNCCDHTFQFA